MNLTPGESHHYDGMSFHCGACNRKVPCSRVYEIYRTLMLERLVFLGDDAA